MKKLLFISLVALLPMGCVRIPVPETQLTWDLTKGTGKVKAPKDSDFSDLKIDYDPVTHKCSVRIGKYSSRNNPEVIDSSSKGAAELVTAVGTQVRGALSDGIQAAEKGAAKALVPLP
jgi:hypothetical protein